MKLKKTKPDSNSFSMIYPVTLQLFSSKIQNIPSDTKLKYWVSTALHHHFPATPVEVHLNVVDEAEIQKLNQTYRHKNKPTNVLAFPSDLPKAIFDEKPLLGDIILCASIIEKESKEQNKSLDAHWAHIVIHGTLHLLGYDHVQDDEALIMENFEITLLKSLGFSNPYEVNDT